MRPETRELLAVVISLLFVCLFYFGILYSTKLTDIVFTHEAKTEASAVGAFISNKESALLGIAESVSADKDIVTAITNENYTDAVSLAKELEQENGIDAVSIFDKFGMVLTRGIPLDRTGDYVFQSSETGRELLMKNETIGIREAVVTPLAIVAGERVYDGSDFAGAITATYFIDDSFAESIKNALGIDIAFFDDKSGIVSSSFNDPRTENALNSYFKLDVLTKDKVPPSGYVTIGGDRYFAFERFFTDPGLSGDGYIVFVPESNALIYISWSVITSLLLLIIFLALHDLRLFAPTLNMKNRSALLLGITFTIVVVFPITLLITDFYISST
jgi:hypothetical protein